MSAMITVALIASLATSSNARPAMQTFAATVCIWILIVTTVAGVKKKIDHYFTHGRKEVTKRNLSNPNMYPCQYARRVAKDLRQNLDTKL